MAFAEKKLSGNVMYKGKFITVECDDVELEDGKCAKRDVVRHNGAVCIVAMNDDNSVYMVRQYRYAVGREMFELPAGKLESGEDPFEAAKRELSEETGCTAKNWEDLGYMYPTPGYSNEILYFYLATGLDKGKMNLDEDEFLTCETVNIHELIAKIENNELHDAKTVYGLYKAVYYLNNNKI